MDIFKATSLIKEIIEESFEQSSIQVEITDKMPLIGGDSPVDSMTLVELCIALEDKASGIGFEFDWTSEKAMSKSRGMFRSIHYLAEEFVNQSKAE